MRENTAHVTCSGKDPKRRSSRLVLLLIAWCIMGSGAQADGAFVWKRGADLNEPSQKAILYWTGDKEVMVLQVKYQGPAEDFAWIVPTPGRPEVTAIAADESPFAEISLYTQRRRKWGSRTDSGKHAVTVLERKIVGVYDVAVLAAEQPGALCHWLNENGYAFPSDREDILAHYTARRWYYVAMRIDRSALGTAVVNKLREGELQPIRFEFAAEGMVYPLRISSLNTGETEILLYALGDTPMVVTNLGRRKGFSNTHNVPHDPRFDDPAYGTFRKATGDELPLTWKALGVPETTELSLCKYRSVFRADDMTDDLSFAPFDPVSFWKQQLADTSVPRRLKVQAAAVLVRRFVAANSTTPASVLASLSRDGVMEVRQAVAGARFTPADVQSLLVNDEESSVRGSLGRNYHAPAEVLRQLASDPARHVRWSVAANPATSEDVLEILTRDANEGVAHRARRALKAR